MPGNYSVFRDCATPDCEHKVQGSALYCSFCWRKTPMGRQEAREAARVNAWRLREKRRIEAGEERPVMHCLHCCFWAGRCSFGFPEAGGEFAAECSMFKQT